MLFLYLTHARGITIKLASSIRSSLSITLGSVELIMVMKFYTGKFL